MNKLWIGLGCLLLVGCNEGPTHPAVGKVEKYPTMSNEAIIEAVKFCESAGLDGKLSYWWQTNKPSSLTCVPRVHHETPTSSAQP